MSSNYIDLYNKILELMNKSGYSESVERLELNVDTLDKVKKKMTYSLSVNDQTDIVHYYGTNLPNWTEANVNLVFSQGYNGNQDLFKKKDNANYIKDIIRNPVNWSSNVQFTVDENVKFLYKKDTVLLSQLTCKFTFTTYAEVYTLVDEWGDGGIVLELEDWGGSEAVSEFEDWNV